MIRKLTTEVESSNCGCYYLLVVQSVLLANLKEISLTSEDLVLTSISSKGLVWVEPTRIDRTEIVKSSLVKSLFHF